MKLDVNKLMKIVDIALIIVLLVMAAIFFVGHSYPSAIVMLVGGALFAVHLRQQIRTEKAEKEAAERKKMSEIPGNRGSHHSKYHK